MWDIRGGKVLENKGREIRGSEDGKVRKNKGREIFKNVEKWERRC